MSERLIASLMKQTRLLSQAGAALSDGMLVEKFVASRDESAFAALVRRHGPMVWAVCRNALNSESDAEDAFQATFLALVQQAGRLVRTAAVGAWLHTTAVRICLVQRRSKRRRIDREARVAKAECAAPIELTWSDELARAHQAIGKLPRREHEVFVLSVLEGMSQQLIARQLGLKLNTVSGLIARATKRLRAQLKSSGTLSLGALAVAASCPAMVPAHLLIQTARLASTSSACNPSILLLSSLALESAMRKVIMCALVTVVLGTGFTVTRWFISASDAQEAKTASTWAGYGQQVPYSTNLTNVPLYASGWEYKTVVCGSPEVVERQINPLGAAGWEVCTTTALPNSERILIVLRRHSTANKYSTVKSTTNSSGYEKAADVFEKVASGQDNVRYRGGNTFGSTSNDSNSVNTIMLKRASAREMAQLLKDVYTNVKITADPGSNTLIVQASGDQWTKLKELVEKLDASNTAK